MHDVEIMLTEVLYRSEFRSLTGNYSRNKLINELAGVLSIADLGKISDQTVEHVKGIIFTSFPDNHFLLSENDSTAFAILMDTFLSEDEILKLMTLKPDLIARRIVCENPKLFCSDLIRATAVLCS